jgi:hypothetical protein
LPPAVTFISIVLDSTCTKKCEPFKGAYHVQFAALRSSYFVHRTAANLLRYSGRMFEKNKLLKSAGEVLGKII